MLLSEGQMSDYKGVALMLPVLPGARELLADKGYDADWFRQALAKRKIAACIPSKSNRKIPIEHDRMLYRERHKIENMFGRLKDWRRIHTRYDRCAHTFMSAIYIAAIVIFWINQYVLTVVRAHLDEVEHALHSSDRFGRCAVRVALIHDGKTEGFVGGMARCVENPRRCRIGMPTHSSKSRTWSWPDLQLL